MNGRNGMMRRVCPVVFIVDASNSMSGRKIGKLNEAISDTFEELNARNKSESSAEFRVAVLVFGGVGNENSVRWVTGGSLVDPGEVKVELEAGGCTPIGQAFRELARVLHENFLLSCVSGGLRPVFMFFTDGKSTDPMDYVLCQLEKLGSDKLFAYSRRIGVGFGRGTDVDVDLIKKFVSINSNLDESELESLFELVDNVDDLADKITTMTIASAMLVTKVNAPSSNGGSKPIPSSNGGSKPIPSSNGGSKLIIPSSNGGSDWSR